MAQNPLSMEVIKQGGISTRETAWRPGISRKKRKIYLAQLQDIVVDPDEAELTGRIYNNDSLAHDEQRMGGTHRTF